jgi:hypothetical protein
MRKLLLLLVLVACEKKPAETPTAAAPAPQPTPTPTTTAPAPTPAPTPPEPAKEAWVDWVHPEKLISAKFPKKPNESKQEAPTPMGPVGVTMAMHGEQTRAFMAGASQYKLPEGGTFDTAKALQGARDQMLAAIKATAKAEKAIKLDGLDGSEIEFEAPGPNPSTTVRGIARVFASDNPPAGYFAAAFRMFEAPDPDALTFLDSVHVAKGVP